MFRLLQDLMKSNKRLRGPQNPTLNGNRGKYIPELMKRSGITSTHNILIRQGRLSGR